ncbi:hypothetical protein A2797_01250 [candidate division WWE3 bacterium RIFCSPHIGHO2_01_FULL_48_15]|uniref:Uncharacterized protein n=1 Tax=candidate division WWE3 bacterium RIFCSPHIGHO2_01_FULL_48_15 TaxID=1802619 RepID=A0A1F4VFK0_UNCKA|nr:MAG: hypothetical protein A2797_01250 [candidate division WWE3 bacterium RIFCSPHIGHO2_01_FULL_48_15]
MDERPTFNPEVEKSEAVVNISSSGETETERLISNFAHTPFDLDGKHYQSVEGFWQGLKFPEGSKEREEASQLFGVKAKKMGKRAGEVAEIEYQGGRIKTGSSEHHELMKRAIQAKLDQNPEVLELLLATGDAKITHVLKRADGTPLPDSKTIPGETFAQILMDLRKELGAYVDFGEIAHQRLHEQTQYMSRYIHGRIKGYPNLGEGLRFRQRDPSDYHTYKIHKDDIEEFARRVEEYEHSEKGPIIIS